MKTDFILVIPARLNSTRLNRKLLLKINGISIIQRTFQKAYEALKDNKKIVIATDSEEIKEHCEGFGANTFLTSNECLTGTDRVAELATKLKKEQYINLQGDEPIFPPEELIKFIKKATEDPSIIHTAIKKIDSEDDYRNFSIPKMVFSKRKKLLYSSRASIPANKSKEFKIAYKHVCVYAFNANHLKIFRDQNKKTFFEKEEDLEINRFLELDLHVNCIELERCGKALDNKEDYEKIKKFIIDNESI